jgi:DNA-binding NtrC family response regulator
MVGKAVLRLPPEGLSMAELEKELVIEALGRNQWNQTKAAAFLRISRNVLVYRMQKYRLGPYQNLSSGPAPEIEDIDEDMNPGADTEHS